ncbi:hypothetical protein E4U53_003747 [Claviceps sorghi]|nr:hypothetical protein E4U53_003747 [Claviceps sorghi]
MQFSTSAALAVIALHARQAFAGCLVSNDIKTHSLEQMKWTADCDNRHGPNTWMCETYGAEWAYVEGAKEMIVNSGFIYSVLEVRCGSHPNIFVRLNCTAGSYHVFHFECPKGDRIMVGEYVSPPQKHKSLAAAP